MQSSYLPAEMNRLDKCMAKAVLMKPITGRGVTFHSKIQGPQKKKYKHFNERKL